MRLRGRICGAALAALTLAGAARAAEGEGGPQLEPYQMVRSLQLLQDRIADGDHAALPMQRKLLEMIDQRFRGTSSQDFIDKKNYEALLVYAMSGGNPDTIDVLLGKLHLDETDRSLGMGILGYLKGDVGTARVALQPVDPMKLNPELGAFFALVKGSVIASQDSEEALKMFDEARLLGPGSLVEEAALRRTIGLATRGLTGPKFLSAAGQYVRRFLRSPYASQFADAFVAGIVALNQTIDLVELDAIIKAMDADQQKVIYLRLARRAAIDGIPGLAEYASGKADAVEIEGSDPSADPRVQLYSALAHLTSETVDQVLPKLKSIDRSKLSESDRRLLDAAAAVATEVTAQPDQPDVHPADQPHVDKAEAAAAPDDGLPEAEPLDGGEPDSAAQPAPVENAETHPGKAAPNAAADGAPVADASPQGAPAPAPADTQSEASAHPADAEPAEEASARTTDGAAPVDTDQTSAIVDDARKKLEEVDKLLEDTAP